MTQDIDFTNYDNALKLLYTDEVTIQDLVNDDNPALAMMAKRTDFEGLYMPQPVIDAYNQSSSSSFASALANQTGGSIQQFQLVTSNLYHLATVDRRTLLSSKNGRGAFMPAAEFAIDGGFVGLANQMSQALYGSGTGVLGQASGTITSGVVNFVNVNSAINFEIGATVDATTTNDSNSSSNMLPALGYVIAVDRDNGNMTLSATQGGSAGTPSGWTAAGLFLAYDGCLNAQPPGFAGWIPYTTPGSGDSFYGVNRSKDPDRLAGVRYDGTSETVEEAILSGSSKLSKLNKAKPNVLFLSPDIFNSLEKSLQGRVIYIEHNVGNVGFAGLKVQGAKGPIEVYQDRGNTTNFGYLLTMKHWKIWSVGPCPAVITDDITGNMLRIATKDAFEIRLGGYWVIACESPGANAVIQFQSA